MEYIQGLEIGSNICEIEFHPTKSILLIVGQKWIGRELKIWKFDKYWSIARISIEILGDDKKFYYFHPTEQEVYIFSSYYSKISRMYFCNYDIQIRKIAEITSYNFYILLKDTIKSLVINHKYLYNFFSFFITKDVNIGFYFNGNLGMLKNILFSEANLKILVPTLYYINFFKPFL